MMDGDRTQLQQTGPLLQQGNVCTGQFSRVIRAKKTLNVETHETINSMLAGLTQLSVIT